MKKSLLISSIFLIATTTFAQPAPKDSQPARLTANDYINDYADDAVRDMKKTGVPASITLAQGMFESDYGNSPLAKEAKNHFGIKCHNEWTGKTYIQDDDEKDECFRKYDDVLQSYDDHSMFLKTRDRYKQLFNLEVTDYKGWAVGLKEAGYATNPQYAERIIKIVEENNLQRFDVQGADAVAQLKEKQIASTAKPLPISKTTNESKSLYNIATNTMCDDIPYVIASKGDTWFKLAKDNNLSLGDIFKYNDVNTNDILRPGMIIYLDSKHNRAEQEFYITKKGDTMWYISQLYGIKLRKLYRHNDVDDTKDLTEGQKIALR